MIKGIMHSADFEENTITLEIQGEFRVMAGGYVLLTDREYEKLSKLHQPTVSGRSEQVCCPRCKSINCDGSGLTLNCNDCDYQWQQTCH